MKLLRNYAFRVNFLIVILAVLFGGCESGEQLSLEDDLALQRTLEVEASPARKIAEYLKDTVSGVTAAEMDERMISHYKIARLMNENGDWTVPELDEISDFLLPGDIGEAETFALIDQMANAAEANEYLVDFLDQAQDETFVEYMSKVDEEGDTVFPDVIAYAHVLERLNVAMRNDWRVLRACRDLWKVEREAAEIGEQMDLFVRAKLASVELIVNKFVKAHEEESVPYALMKGILPLNIMEAVASDVVDGNRDNALAGTILAKYVPGRKKYNETTGEGPSSFSDDGKGILLNMALPGKWADLYATWNLAFVTAYPYPHMMVKLLIPSVNDYRDEPAEYIYNRAMALYTHIHWGLIRKVDLAAAGEEKVDWPDDHLTKFWGQVNKENAKEYNREARAAKYPWLFW